MKRWNIYYLTLASFISTLFFLLFAVFPQGLGQLYHALQGFGWPLGVVMFALGCYGVYAMGQFIRWHWAEVSHKTLSITTDEGVSAIGLETVEDLLRVKLGAEKDLSNVRTTLSVQPDGKTVDCHIHFNVQNQADLPGRLDVHKRAVRDLFKSLIPGDIMLNVTCVVDEIMMDVADKNKPSEKERRSTATMAREFNGMVYPVAGDDQIEERDDNVMG